MVKMAAFRPIPSASVSTTADVKLPDRLSCRAARRSSRMTSNIDILRLRNANAGCESRTCGNPETKPPVRIFNRLLSSPEPFSVQIYIPVSEIGLGAKRAGNLYAHPGVLLHRDSSLPV